MSTLLLLLLASVRGAPTATLSCGATVTGVALREAGYADVDAFYSIRFATAARFAHARDEPCTPHAALNASAPGAQCVQFTRRASPRAQSEDCLSLDVFRPSSSSSSSAQVLFWIYGGGNCFGASDSYDGLPHIAALENVVLVAANYRLGALGYLATRELSREQGGASGNYGIGDLVSALRFVQREIAHFGGDPTRVTLIGQSSG